MNIIIVSLPPLGLIAPPLGPASIKAYVELHTNHTVTTDDLNIRLWNYLSRLDSSIPHWDDGTFILEDTVWEVEKQFDEMYQKIEPFIRNYCHDIMRYDMIGLSAISFRTKFIMRKVCQLIRSMDPNKQIILGGPYATYAGVDFQTEGLIDIFHAGAGEKFVECLMERRPYIPMPLTSMDHIPPPDFSDADLMMYPKQPHHPDPTNMGGESLYIRGSEGCVRNCNFCNVSLASPKYVSKTGPQIANEISHLRRKYPINHLYFTDSVINGSTTNLVDKCTSIIKSIEFTDQSPIPWTANAIIRSSASFGEDCYRLMADAGAAFLRYGIESGSLRVREAMNKKGFTNSDIFQTFEWCGKYSIMIGINLMVGFPSETDEEFNETIKLIDVITENYSKIVSGTCLYIAHPFVGTEILDCVVYDPSVIDEDIITQNLHWSDTNGMDFDERSRRYLVAREHIKQIGNESKVFMETYDFLIRQASDNL